MTSQDSSEKLQRSRRRLNQIEQALKAPDLKPEQRQRLRHARSMQRAALKLRLRSRARNL